MINFIKKLKNKFLNLFKKKNHKKKNKDDEDIYPIF